MTPDTIRQAVYDLGQAASTLREAELGGGELGRALAAQFKAHGVASKMLNTATTMEIDRVLLGLIAGKNTHHGEVARSALHTWRREMYLNLKVASPSSSV